MFKAKDYPSEAIAYHGMKTRCYNPNDEFYHRYGGRNIKVADEFLLPNGAGFHNFLEYIGPKPGPEYSIDRIETDGNYEKGNIKWSTIKEQANNRSNNHLITYEGRTQTLTQWCEELDLNFSLMSSRLNYLKMSFEEAISKEKTTSGCKGNHTKLTKEDVIEIFYSTEEYKTIADRFGIALAAISRIKNRVRYKEETKDLGDPGRSDNPNNSRRNNK